MKIYEFTVPELELLRAYCNFTAEERQLFDMRSQHIPLEECAENMNVSVSTAKRISRKVNKKILKVC